MSGGQVSVGLDTQLCHRVGDGGGGNGTHTDALFLRVFSIVPNFAERGKGWTKKCPAAGGALKKATALVLTGAVVSSKKAY